MGDTLALKFDAFNLMQRVRRQITFPATWTCYYRHVFDHEEFPALAVASSDFPNQRTLASTNIADHSVSSHYSLRSVDRENHELSCRTEFGK